MFVQGEYRRHRHPVRQEGSRGPPYVGKDVYVMPTILGTHQSARPRGRMMLGADCSVPSPLRITDNVHAAVSVAHGR